MRLQARFKTSSRKVKGEKTGEYNFWSVVSLIVNIFVNINFVDLPGQQILFEVSSKCEKMVIFWRISPPSPLVVDDNLDVVVGVPVVV